MPTDADYLAFNPFQGDRDVSIECRKVQIVITNRTAPKELPLTERDKNTIRNVFAAAEVHPTELMEFECDHCGQAFTDTKDVSGDSCNRCDEGIIQRAA